MSTDNEEKDFFDEESVPEEKPQKTKEESAAERELQELEKVTTNMRHNWVRTTAATVAVIIVLGFVTWIWMIFWNPTTSMQQRIGYVNELKCTGKIFKTFEGELLTYEFMYDTIMKPQIIFEFSVDNDSVAHLLSTLRGTGTKVVVTYKEYDATLPWRGDSKRIVYAVEERK